MLSVIQDWLRTNKKQPIQIHLFRFDQEAEVLSNYLKIYYDKLMNSFFNKDWILYKNDSYDASLQWCLRLNIKPGQYLIIYESG